MTQGPQNPSHESSFAALEAELESGCATIVDLEARLRAERARLAELRKLTAPDQFPPVAFGFVLPAAD